MSVLWGALYALLGAVAGVLATKFGEDVYRILRTAALSLKRHVPRIQDYFIGEPSKCLDICVFTATARQHLPLTDVLYFEYLRYALKTQRVNRLILGRWHPVHYRLNDADTLISPLNQEGWKDYDTYVNGLFYEFGDRVLTVVSDEQHEKALLTPLFWRSLDDISNNKHWLWAKRTNVSRRKLRRLQATKPGDQLKGLIAQTISNTQLATHVIAGLIDCANSTANERPSLGVLFWEIELDRLAVYVELHQAARAALLPCGPFDLFPVMGRTIRRSRNRVSNNHSRSAAVGMSIDESSRIEAVSNQTRREAVEYVRIVSLILQENYDFSVARSEWESRGEQLLHQWAITADMDVNVRLNRRQKELLYLVSELRAQQIALSRRARTAAAT